MTMLEPEQMFQDEEYGFPYHYLTSFENGAFRHFSNDTWGINYVSTIEFLLEHLGGIDFSSIVDIGCGDGRFTKELWKRFPGSRVAGVDYSSKAIGLAKAMNCDVQGISFEVCDITRVNTDAKFDVAVLMEVLEHIPPDNAAAFIYGIHKLLRPGGVLLLTVPHTNKPVAYKHYRHFNSALIGESLADYFEIVKVIPFEKISLTRTIVNQILANRLFILSNARLLKMVYTYYKQHLFYCSSETSCQRLFVHATAK
jgi:2-polyprenyl-3-methyl-5-hydroxy-6-metoxy-1,4-benzoquinol methylase